MRRLAAACLFAAVAACEPGAGGASNSKAKYCEIGDQSSLFLVDRTTQYDDTDQRVIIESIGAVIDGLGVGDRIVLATIGSHYSQSASLANDCKPGCPQNQGPLDSMVGGCSAMIAQADLRGFKTDLVKSLGPLTTTAEEAKNSDIAGTIAQWTQAPPGGRPFTSIYVFSDMLENSQGLPWSQFKAMAPDKAMELVERFKLTPSAKGAAVRIVGFGRLHDPGRPPLPAELDARLRTFWTTYFQAGGATSVSFEGAIRQ
jgi:hypothetical protein